jgi:hypothetical protein
VPDWLVFSVRPTSPARRATASGSSGASTTATSTSSGRAPTTSDRARLGGGRLAWPESCGEDAVPDWLVFSGMLIAAQSARPRRRWRAKLSTRATPVVSNPSSSSEVESGV